MNAFDLAAAGLAAGGPDSPDDRRNETAVELLGPADRAWLLDGYRQSLPLAAGTETELGVVVADVLAAPGSLVRAQLAFALMRSLGVAREPARALATGIEYFHTASLLFDDLPAMDDARMRRGRTCPHVVHGEAAAILGALAFVNQGYALLWSVLGDLPASRRERARHLVADSLGLAGILNGQALDLQFGNSARPGERAVLRVADGKTVSLVRLTLLLAAIVGGASETALRSLDRLSTTWGRTYQILDDFKDCVMSVDEAGKTTSRDTTLARPNLPLRIGRQRAMRRLDALLDESRGLLLALGAIRSGCPALGRLQERLERERAQLGERLAELRQAMPCPA